jgi:hypothetical protein
MSRDKELRAHEAAVESTDQDDWDMQRLGKVQQLKVRWNWSVGRRVERMN